MIDWTWVRSQSGSAKGKNAAQTSEPCGTLMLATAERHRTCV